jgi:hypothetical protein
MSEALTTPVRTDVVSRKTSLQWLAMSFSSSRPAMNGSRAGQLSAFAQIYSRRSARLGIRGAKRNPNRCANANT